MAYVATRGGERAIEQSERLFREEMGDITAERVAEIRASMPYLIDRVMGEASLYDEDLAALALAQTGGELYEAALLLRAWRTTQPRLCVAEPITQESLLTHRRISAAFKDIPGGQILGPTLDYSHRILATEVLAGDTFRPEPVEPAEGPAPARQPSVAAWQAENELLTPPEPDTVTGADIPDVTREPLLFPAKRAHTLQSLARAETGGGPRARICGATWLRAGASHGERVASGGGRSHGHASQRNPVQRRAGQGQSGRGGLEEEHET